MVVMIQTGPKATQLARDMHCAHFLSALVFNLTGRGLDAFPGLTPLMRQVTKHGWWWMWKQRNEIVEILNEETGKPKSMVLADFKMLLNFIADQRREPVDVETNKHTIRPGDVFSIVIFKLTGQPTSNCSICARRHRQMNYWGWLGCLKNQKTIISWLVAEAKKNGYDIQGETAFALFVTAFKLLKNGTVKMKYDVIKTTTTTETFEVDCDNIEDAQAAVEAGKGIQQPIRSSIVKFQFRPSKQINLTKMVDQLPNVEGAVQSAALTALTQKRKEV